MFYGYTCGQNTPIRIKLVGARIENHKDNLQANWEFAVNGQKTIEAKLKTS